MPVRIAGKRFEIRVSIREQVDLPVEKVAGFRIVRRGSRRSGLLVLQEFNTRPFHAAQARDPHAPCRDAAEEFLLSAVVKALPNNGKSQQVSIEVPAVSHVAHDDRCMVEAQEKPAVSALPFWFAFVGRKLDQLLLTLARRTGQDERFFTQTQRRGRALTFFALRRGYELQHAGVKGSRPREIGCRRLDRGDFDISGMQDSAESEHGENDGLE